MKDRANSSSRSFQGSDKLIFGILLGVVTFRLFAQTTFNIASRMRVDLRISEGLNNISAASLQQGELVFNIALAVITAIAVAITLPKDDPRETKS